MPSPVAALAVTAETVTVAITPPSTPPLHPHGDGGAKDDPAYRPVSPISLTSDAKNCTLLDIRGSVDSGTTGTLISTIVNAFSNPTVRLDPSTMRNGDHSPVADAVMARYADGGLLRSIPTLVLYDDKGLNLFDQITFLDEYYLTNAEIDIFTQWADEIIRTCVHDGGVIIELGVGSMRKTRLLLDAIVRQKKAVTYYAIDLQEVALVTSLQPLAALFPTVNMVGLVGTYEDALHYVRYKVPHKTPTGQKISRTILWLGSSIGNLTREDAAVFLAKVKDEAMEVGDTFLCGIDRRNDPREVKLAYDDRQGITREFILNGLDHVNRILAGAGSSGSGSDVSDSADAPETQPVFSRDGWEYLSVYNASLGRHEAYLQSLKRQSITFPSSSAVVVVEKDELVSIEFSVKYSPREVAYLVDGAGLHTSFKWTDVSGRYDLHLMLKPPFALRFLRGVDSAESAAQIRGVPSLADFEDIWKCWDVIIAMVPPGKHLERPIQLRHPCVFYFGHMPSFMDILISRCLGEPTLTPELFPRIFERGIDPDMEDTTKCHPHSHVPDQWPELSAVLEYKDRCNSRMREILRGATNISGKLARVVWMIYEHYAMHIETFLYMLTQCDGQARLAPAGFVAPPHLTRGPEGPHPAPLAPASLLESIPASATVTLGHDDAEALDATRTAAGAASHAFGWDNERPARRDVVVTADPRRRIQSRPITVGEYHAFLAKVSSDDRASLIPESWNAYVPDDVGASTVRTVFGPVSLRNVINWPVYISHVQASAYASHAGAVGLPTEAEMVYLRSQSRARGGDVVANHGFRSWVPTDVDERRGVGADGWEWTDTLLAAHEGFASSPLYPGYTSDFFDGKHNVLVGGSWATAPRIANRPTFRNWYQRGYGFTFATARLVFLD